MEQSRAFWAGFGLLCGACLLSAVNPCVGIFAVFYLVLAFVVLMGYLTMRRRALNLRSLEHRSEQAREAMALLRSMCKPIVSALRISYVVHKRSSSYLLGPNLAQVGQWPL